MIRRMNLQGNIEMEKYRSVQTSKKTWRYKHVEIQKCGRIEMWKNRNVGTQRYRNIETWKQQKRI